MRIFAFFTLSFFLLATNVFAENSPNTTKAEVLKEFEKLVEAARSLEHSKYIKFFDKNKFSSLNENGTVTHDFDSFSATVEKGFSAFKSYDSLEFDKVKVTVIDSNMAILVNEFTATVILHNGDALSVAGAGTQVWSKHSGSWKLVNVSGSSRPLPVGPNRDSIGK
jgi:hypothetical protein